MDDYVNIKIMTIFVSCGEIQRDNMEIS